MTIPLPGVVHMRVRNGRKRYRVFIVHENAYATSECSEQQLRRYLLDEGVKLVQRSIETAVSTANIKGSSLPFANISPLDGPWPCEERSQSMRHEFTPMTGGARCSRCGNMESAAVHARAK